MEQWWKITPLGADGYRRPVLAQYGYGTANEAAEYVALTFEHGAAAEVVEDDTGLRIDNTDYGFNFGEILPDLRVAS